MHQNYQNLLSHLIRKLCSVTVLMNTITSCEKCSAVAKGHPPSKSCHCLFSHQKRELWRKERKRETAISCFVLLLRLRRIDFDGRSSRFRVKKSAFARPISPGGPRAEVLIWRVHGDRTGCRAGSGGKLSNSWFDGLTWLCLAAA